MSGATASIGITVQGMSCGHCQSSVLKGLQAIEGVRAVSLDLASGNGSVEVEESRFAELKEAVKSKVEELGYSIQLA